METKEQKQARYDKLADKINKIESEMNEISQEIEEMGDWRK